MDIMENISKKNFWCGKCRKIVGFCLTFPFVSYKINLAIFLKGEEFRKKEVFSDEDDFSA